MSAHISHGWSPPSVDEIATLFPKYEVLELAAVGGLSSVYRIQQPDLERSLALKFLRRGGPENGEWPTRFRKEALIMSRIKHGTIPTVYDFGRVGTDWFCVMEFIEGISMHVGHYTADWSLPQVQSHLAEAAEGLHELHEDGVVHGDIKPDNIMVNNEQEVKLIDFGTACTPGERKLVTDMVGPRQFTAGFAAPELHDCSLTIDRRVDVYGLGATMLQFLIGEAPPESFEETRLAIEKLPRHERKFFTRCLSLNPSTRPSSALEFAAELRKLPLLGPVRVKGAEPRPQPQTTKAVLGMLKAKLTAFRGN